VNLVDSSGWLEYFAGGVAADAFDEPLADAEALLVPTICLYEVFRVVLRERGEQQALQAAALMKQGRVVNLTEEIALRAALIGHNMKLPMADSIILATARAYDAVLWTMDADFKDVEGVRFILRG